MSVTGIGGAYRIPDADLQPPPPPPAPAAEIDGTAGDPVSRTDASTTDGKSIQQDVLHTDDGLEIRRERTHTIDQNGQRVTSDQLVVDTTSNGSADDRVDVRSNDDGSIDVYVNGERYPTTLAEGQEITIRTGDGNDTIWVDSDISVNIVADSGAGDDFIMGGAGNDRIDAGTGNDTVYAGAGRDDVFGNSGDDHLSGGEGNDVVYGGDGSDFMTGTTGNDYLEGGRGEDTLWGGAGDDILSGGRDNDKLEGDGGNDTVYTGLGIDSVENSGGRDQVYAQQAEDTITIGQYADDGTTSNVVVNVVVSDVEGVTIDPTASGAFRQRVEADLDLMRASPVGQQLLADLQDAADNRGNAVMITELQNEENGFAAPVPAPGQNWQDIYATSSGPGAGTDATVVFNPSFHADGDPNVANDVGFPSSFVVLHHELSHAYNDVTGTMQRGEHQDPNSTDGPHVVIDPNSGRQFNVPGINNAERQAVGLETDPPAGNPNPEYATENGIREEMGLPDRPVYRTW